MASNDIAFSVFEAETGNLLRDLPGSHPGRPRNVNGATVLIASPEESILAVIFGRALKQPLALYSTGDWAKLADLPDGQRPETAAFSRDGRLLAVGRLARYVLIYDVSSVSLVQQIDAFPDVVTGAATIAFNPDSTMIAVGSHSGWGIRRLPNDEIERLPNGSIHFVPPGDPVRLFQVKDGARVAANNGAPEITGNITWSADGRIIAFTTKYRFLHLWNPNPFQSGVSERVLPLSEASNVGPVAFSPDGKRLAVGVGPVVKIYEVVQ
jgi:WD40 repeat protein